MSEKKTPLSGNVDRRELLKVGAAGIGAAMLGASASTRTVSAATPAGLGQAPADLFAAPPMEQVRIGFVGVGLQGSSHCRNLLRIEGVQLKALCDIVPEKVTRVQQWTEDAGQPKPTAYTRGEWDFRRMCEEEELDLVHGCGLHSSSEIRN